MFLETPAARPPSSFCLPEVCPDMSQAACACKSEPASHAGPPLDRVLKSVAQPPLASWELILLSARALRAQ
jgi:hypothetical protein